MIGILGMSSSSSSFVSRPVSFSHQRVGKTPLQVFFLGILFGVVFQVAL